MMRNRMGLRTKGMRKRMFNRQACILAGAMLFAASAAAQNTFPASGNVGIGIMIPGAVLDVERSNWDNTSPVLKISGQESDTPALLVFNGNNGGAARFTEDSSQSIYQPTVEIVAAGNDASSEALGIWNNNGSNEIVSVHKSGNVGIGTTNPQAKLEINGGLRFTADGSVQTTAWTGVLCGGDYAESVGITGPRKEYEPGDVMVVDPAHPGNFVKSSQAYSTLVAGIYSTKPGAIGKRTAASSAAPEIPMAMIGIVPAKVSAENGPVNPGDLLVTSSTVGYVMKGIDRERMTGAIVGKALGSVPSGTGVIEVMVTLQ